MFFILGLGDKGVKNCFNESNVAFVWFWLFSIVIHSDWFFIFFSFLKFCDNLSRLMLLEKNQIAFHSEDGLIFNGVKDYTRQLAEMIGLASDGELRQAGVSLPYTVAY